MADIKDVADVIQSALTEIGVSGSMNVAMDGEERKKDLGSPRGDEVEIEVIVHPVDQQLP